MGQITSIDNTNGILEYRQTPTGLSLPDSPAAADLIKRAVFEESQKHWENAAELYQQASSQFPNRVIEVKAPADSGISHYVGTSQIIQSQLEKWPDDALDIYKGLYEQTADNLLRSARPHQAGTLLNVFWNYGPSDAGKQAGIALVDLYLEAGDFRAAITIGHQLARLVPVADPDQAMILLRVALAEHYSGADAACRAELAQLLQHFPEAVGVIGGKTVRLVDALEKACAAAPLPTGQTDHLVNEISANNDGGSRAGSASVNGLRRIARVAFTSSANPFSPTVMPALDGAALYFQDGRALYALDVKTGHPLSTWLGSHGGKAGLYDCGVAGLPGNQLHTIVVSPSMVFAVMGQSEPGASVLHGEATAPAATTKLVCVERTSGRQVWTCNTSQIPEPSGTLRKAEYDGTPLLVPAMFTGAEDADGSVLVTARTGRFNQFDECYVVCLSAKTGEFRWLTYLGGATHDAKSSGQPAQMTFVDGQIFVITNLGVIASLSPADGRVTWLNAYPHNATRTARNIFENNSSPVDRSAAGAGLPAWSVNPALVDNGQLYLLPSDSKKLFVLDDQTGNVVHGIPMDSFENANLLVGTDQGTLLLASQRKVFALDCNKLTPDADPAAATVWTADLSFGDDSQIAGRCFFTGESILVPTTHRLVQINGGRIRATYPTNGEFQEGEGPGNMLASGSSVITAGMHSIDIYVASPSVARSRGRSPQSK